MEATVSIAAVIAVIGFAITVFNFFQGRKHETQAEDGKLEGIRTNLVTVEIKLDQVMNTTNETRADIKETRTDIKTMNAKIQDLDKDMSIVKRDLQTAFKRIEELKEGTR